MPEFVQPSDAASRRVFCALPNAPVLEERLLSDADEHWLAISADAAVARCSLWWSQTPQHNGERLGYVGHYGAVDGVDDAASDLLRHATARLAAQGCARAIGPIDGSTWRRYRFISERGAEPPFFLEPDNPDAWPDHFRAAAFEPFAHYSSASDSALDRRDPRLPDLSARMAKLGVRVRTIDPSAFDDEVQRIHGISLQSFRHNFLFSPMTQAQCIALYQPLEQYIKPELVFIAEQGDRPVGFCFSVPDWLQAKRGQRIDTLIVKTLAIVPEPDLAGLGGYLLDSCRRRAAELGYRRAIHALMQDENTRSRSLSERFGSTIRRYTLYARALRP